MPRRNYSYKLAVREKGPEVQYSPGVSPSVESSHCCAYNETRERFLSADVEAADFSAMELNPRLATLQPGSDKALCIVPFRGISPTLVRVPVDLIYLDENDVVLAAVESFPLYRISDSSKPAASVLALPAHSISSAGTCSGDQLIVCSPADMTRRLQKLTDAQSSANAQGEATDEDRVPPRSTGNVLPWVSRPGPADSVVSLRTEIAAAGPLRTSDPAPEPTVSEPEQDVRPAKNWLQRLFSAAPPEPRQASREALTGLVAHFFTGGTPVAHGIRDMSLTGLYVFTKERWYVGTIVRMTLSDFRQPTVERTLTVNARVVRWGNDGVGLEFVLQDKKNRRRDQSSAFDDPAAAVTNVQLEQFIQRFRSGRL